MKLTIPNANFTDIYFKTSEATTRYVVSYGGSGSSKSYSEAQNEIIRCLRGKEKVLVIRKVGDTLRDSVVALIKDIIYEWDLSDIVVENKSDRTFTFPNDSQIICRGLDDPDKIKSLHGITRVWCEEIDQLSEDEFTLLGLRIRGFDNIQFVLTFNPILETHWLKKLFFESSKYKEKATIIRSTYKDNPFLDDEYKRHLNELKEFNYNFYVIYALGEWGKPEVKKPFAYAFNRDINVTKGLKFNYKLPVILSFDFNIDPITCIACQHDYDKIEVIKEFRLTNSDIYELCEVIRTSFKGANVYFKITGDASGQNRSAMTRGGLNYYKIIKDELQIADTQFIIPTFNPSLKNSRVLLNALLMKHPSFKINENCKFLIDDLLYCEVKEDGEIDKTKDAYRSHLLDCIRYYVNTFHLKYLDNNMLNKIMEKN